MFGWDGVRGALSLLVFYIDLDVMSGVRDYVYGFDYELAGTTSSSPR